MAINKGQIVEVELVIAGFSWKCPNCNHDNEQFEKRYGGHVSELTCEQCDTVIEKEGEILWKIK